MPGPEISTLRRRLELGRLVIGSLVEMGIKAYGVGAVVAVALSDAETVGGKASDAFRAVPSLAEEYDQARYVVDHREQIQAAVTYLNEHTLPQEELERTADESVATLDGISTTYDEVGQGIEALKVDGLDDFPDVGAAYGHLQNAFNARPDLTSIRELAEVADQVGPLVDQVEVLTPVYYGGVLALVDNFASDEIASTLVVMALAFGLAMVLAHAVGFWVRRGRPGLLAQLVQALGARTWRRWYVHNLPWALSPPLYDAAREHLQREIVADPEQALDPDTFRELEQYFASRADDSAR
jgi:hypothetical protein